jgi:hypothetical protein
MFLFILILQRNRNQKIEYESINLQETQLEQSYLTIKLELS